MSDIKLTGEGRRMVLASLDHRERNFRDALEHHNTTLPFKKKETFLVQGFEVKGLTLAQARRRVRKFLVNAGFSPPVTNEHFISWRNELSKEDEEE